MNTASRGVERAAQVRLPAAAIVCALLDEQRAIPRRERAEESQALDVPRNGPQVGALCRARCETIRGDPG
jgi:hypothetical protein